MSAGGEPKQIANAQNIQGARLASRGLGARLLIVGGEHHDLSAGVQPANRVEGRRARAAAHIRRCLVRAARHRRARKAIREPCPHAVRHLAISGRRRAGRQREERHSNHSPDRAGADTIGEPRWQGDRLPVGQRRARATCGSRRSTGRTRARSRSSATRRS